MFGVINTNEIPYIYDKLLLTPCFMDLINVISLVNIRTNFEFLHCSDIRQSVNNDNIDIEYRR